ncbi:MAG: HIT domain-containing protein [Nanoarchaeota archaeon]|nr:HIT domain-containing protein [Nanoarchaeota archaeon]
MEFSREQIEELKKQILEQIESSFPEDKKKETSDKIKSMGDEEFIEFLKQNNLIKTADSKEQTQCIFCSMVFGEIPTTKIAENEKAIAILELNPVSEGHTLIIPKNHIIDPNEIDEGTQELAGAVKEKLQGSLSPKEIQVYVREVMGHEAINLVPVYNEETIDSPRTKKTPEELKSLQEKITSQEEIKPQETEKINEEKQKLESISEEEMILPKRLP